MTPEENGAVIRVCQLAKRYKNIEAIKNIDFSVKRGEIFGLIGPDGAGKTTLLHILAGIMEQTSGEVFVLSRRACDVRPHIGYLTQQFSLHLDLSVQENINYCSGLREIPKNISDERSAKYLRLMGLEQFDDRLAGQLSGGMKQKLALCCALISRPDILLLDEPTTGVDPISRREFWDILASISQDGVTIVVATPYLDEAERCNHVALMHNGEIYEMGTPSDLRARTNLKRLEVSSNQLEELEQDVQKDLPNMPFVKDLQRYGDRLDVLVDDADTAKKYLQLFFTRHKFEDIKIEVQQISLENVFVLSLRQRAVEIPFKSFFLNITNSEQKSGSAIAADNISKKFDKFTAVNKVSLQVKYGEIYGLLGANGAGKTTTIKMLCGLFEPSSGRMSLAGQSQDLRNSALRKRMGYMSQKFTLYDDLNVLDNLQFYAGVYEVPLEIRKERINWVLEVCGLIGQEKMLTGRLPGGWKQRLSFGASIMHKPEILFLDEPTSGVDPIARRQLWKMIMDFAKHNTAVLVTTHFLDEAEHCHQLGLMVGGELVEQGSPGNIKSSQPGKLYEIITDKNQVAANILKQHIQSWRVAIFADCLHVVLDNPDEELLAVRSLLASGSVQIKSQRIIPFSLEDAFIGIVQRAKV